MSRDDDEREPVDLSEASEAIGSTVEAAVLPTPGAVVFPGTVESVYIHSPYGITVIDRFRDSSDPIWAVRSDVEPSPEHTQGGMPSMGTLCRILGVREAGSGQLRVELDGVCRARLEDVLEFKPEVRVRLNRVDDEALGSDAVGELAEKCLLLLEALAAGSRDFPSDLAVSMRRSVDQPGALADRLAAELHMPLVDRDRLLGTASVVERLGILYNLLEREHSDGDAEVGGDDDVDRRARQLMERRRRIDYLRAQMSEIKKELGELTPIETEIDEFEAQMARRRIPADIARQIRAELDRLQQLSTASAEYSGVRNYIEWMINLPWTARAEERTDPVAIRTIIDSAFYGQKRAKERLIEYVSVMHRTGRAGDAIPCLVGPIGIGKTRLAMAAATALRRPFINLNMGILRSEAMLKGNRRTFPGAMPGRLMRDLRRVGVVNPVCLLDEIDLMGNEGSGPDLSAILLEIIDAQTNHAYIDAYLGVRYDLSNVLFMASATNAEEIPELLADRLEFIELPGYLFEEKIEIAFKHLLPNEMEQYRLTDTDVGFSIAAMERIIQEYTLEAGLAGLSKQLEVVCRHMSAERAAGRKGTMRIGVQQIEGLLGPPPYIPERVEKHPEIGVAMGLAWTQTGGDVMLIEGLKMRGAGSVILTGSLGDVMRESIQAAHSYIRSRADWLGIAHKDFERYDIHIHFPQGAIPKDGPSAGITVTLVIASVLSDRPIANDIAMTGEVTLRGKVLPVGGVKEKVAAAHRVGFRKLILPQQNVKDLKDIPRRIDKEMTYIPVETVDEVFAAALLDFDAGPFAVSKLLAEHLQQELSNKRSKTKRKSSPSGAKAGATRKRKPSAAKKPRKTLGRESE